MAASIAAVLAVRAVAVAILQPPPGFMPLTVLPAIIDTAAFVTLAVIVFYRVVSGGHLPGPLLALLGASLDLSDPIRTFRAIAARVLLVSLLPAIAVALSNQRWSYGVALASMHVVAWAVCVTILTSLAPKDRSA